MKNRDIVIPFRYCDPNADRLLRWTLRSIAKHLHSAGRIVIVGDLPYWVTKDTSLVVPVAYWHYHKKKFQNLAAQVMFAIRAADIQGEFLYAGNDIFHLTDADANEVPYLYRREAIRGYNEYFPGYNPKKDGERGYVDMMIHTRRILSEAGLPVVEYEGHVTRPLNADFAREVTRLLQNATGEVSCEISCIFGNVAGAHGAVKRCEKRADIKLYDYDLFRQIVDEGKEYVFSVHPSLLSDARFVADMDSMYGEPCKYEMW